MSNPDIQLALQSLEIGLKGLRGRTPRSEEEIRQWEADLIRLFSEVGENFTPYPNYFRERTLEFKILRQLSPEFFNAALPLKSCLELGCGFGYKSLLLHPFFEEVTGTDIPVPYPAFKSVFGTETSSKTAEALIGGLLGYEKFRFLECWPGSLPLADGSQRFLYSEYVLEHIPDLPAAIREMGRVLEPGAAMLHIVPNTKDALLAMANANIHVSLTKVLKGLAKWILGRKPHGKVSLNGTIIPACHSEFINDYSDQLKVYSLENYLYPMVESGFKIERVFSIREHNNVIVARKI